MKVTKEKEENRQVVLVIEMEPAEMQTELDLAYHRLAQRAEIPGFRKGKAPRDVLERHIGKDRLLEDALGQAAPQGQPMLRRTIQLAMMVQVSHGCFGLFESRSVRFVTAASGHPYCPYPPSVSEAEGTASTSSAVSPL